MYVVTHHFLTTNDHGDTIVAVEAQTTNEIEEVPTIVAHMIEAPGGTSGTTISLTVSRTRQASL